MLHLFEGVQSVSCITSTNPNALEMELTINSCVQGPHIYKNTWIASHTFVIDWQHRLIYVSCPDPMGINSINWTNLGQWKLIDSCFLLFRNWCGWEANIHYSLHQDHALNFYIATVNSHKVISLTPLQAIFVNRSLINIPESAWKTVQGTRQWLLHSTITCRNQSHHSQFVKNEVGLDKSHPKIMKFWNFWVGSTEACGRKHEPR